MPKFYKSVDGKKFYCNETGELTQKDGENVEVPESDTTAVDVESGSDEATKMLSDAMQKAIAEGDKVAVATVKKAQEAVSEFFESVAEGAKSKTVKVDVVSSKSSFDVERVEKGLAELAEGNRESVSFEVKSAKDVEYLAKTTSRDDLTGEVIVPEVHAEVTRDPVRAGFMENIAKTTETTSDSVAWVEVVTETGAPATTAELATIPEKDFEFQRFTSPLQKIAVINKHSVELLQDAPQLVSAIKTWLNEDLKIVTDTQLLSGNGTAPNLQGVLGVSTDLDATAIGTQRVANANKFDVLRIAQTKIATAGKGHFRPNYIVLNPADAETLDLTKNADGDYIMPSFYSADGLVIRGARIIENTAITAGTFLVGDFSKMNVFTKGGTTIDITHSDGTDFAKDIITVKLRRRVGTYVRANDDGAFQTGSFSGVITALTA